MANGNHRLAVLIDADNAQAPVIQELLAEVSRYGTATIKRAMEKKRAGAAKNRFTKKCVNNGGWLT